MINKLKSNTDKMMKILKEISEYYNKLSHTNNQDDKLIMKTIQSLKITMKIINSATLEILKDIGNTKRIKDDNKQVYNNVEIPINKNKEIVFISSSSRKDILKELRIQEINLKRLRKSKKNHIAPKEDHYISSRGYVKLSNKLFLNKAIKSVKKGWFKRLNLEIGKANIGILFKAYLAMMYMTAFISIIVGIFIVILFIFFDFSFSYPYVKFFEGNFFIRLFSVIWLPFLLPIISFGFIYYYPTLERKSLAMRIDQELPFAVIYMSAIAGSGIEPTQIFRIIGLNKDYPYLRKEIRKVLNQVNLYGYDLVTALNNTARDTSSTKLAELFSGLGTTINSGGDFSDFFEKRADTLLNEYKIERQVYTKNAETFMDVYISLVIAAPMILMLFLVVLIIGNFNVGLSIPQLTVIVISGTIIINLFFIMFIHMKQPSY